MKDKKETAQEVPVLEQQENRIIHQVGKSTLCIEIRKINLQVRR